MKIRPDKASGSPINEASATDPIAVSSQFETPASESGGHRHVIKSSAIIGLSTVITLGMGIVRAKILAALLGPAGIGLMGVYNSIVALAASLTGLGVGQSAVRQISKAVGAKDQIGLARSVFALRRLAIGLGLFGGVALATLAGPVSRFSFGNSEHLFAVALLGCGVFFSTIGNAQGALIQGMRRMRQVAMVNICSGLSATVLSLPILLLWRRDGIAAFCVAVLASTAFVSWLFARQVILPPTRLTWREIWKESRETLKLGLGFLSAGLIAAASAYLARLLVLKETGEHGAGIFQAAYVLAMTYVGFILQAMGTDYYPRLAAIAHDNVARSQVINEQVEISLLFALPGVMATIAFAPIIIPLFYSSGFASAVDILRWQCAGALLRLASYPMSYLLIAKGESRTFTILEALFAAVQLALLWLCLKWFGLFGSGIAYCLAYLIYWVSLVLLVKYRYHFTWSATNLKLAALSLTIVLANLIACMLARTAAAIAIGVLSTAIVGTLCGKALFKHSGITSVRQALQAIKAKLVTSGASPR